MMVPKSEQKKYNRLGDCYSKKESLDILEGVCKEADAPVKAEKEKVESLYQGNMMSATARYRQSVANRLNIYGVGLFADNVGLVSIRLSHLNLGLHCALLLVLSTQAVVSRFNKGVGNANKYLTMTMSVPIEHRLPTAHIRWLESTCKVHPG